MNHRARPALLLLTAAAIILALLLATGVVKTPGEDPAAADGLPTGTSTNPTVPPGAACNATNHFFASDVKGHKFGPEAPTTAPEAVAELKHRVSCGQDPALAVATTEYLQSAFTGPEERVTKTFDTLNNADGWNFAASVVNQALDNGNPRIETMHKDYQTLYMTLDGGRTIPEIFATHPDKPSFLVLTIDTPQGVKHFKLDCGFQPVEQDFPSTIPTKSAPPSKSQPPKEKVTHPVTTQPTPKSTTPPPAPTTVPPTTPPGPQPTTTVAPPPPPTQPTTTIAKCAKMVNGYCDNTGGTPANPTYGTIPVAAAPTPGYTQGSDTAAAPNNATNGTFTPAGQPSTAGSDNGQIGGTTGGDAPLADTGSGQTHGDMPAHPA